MSDSGFNSKRRSMSSVNKVLSSVVSSLNLDKRLKEHTLMSLWLTIIGEPFASKSRPLFIDHEGSMVIAVSEAAVGQELSLMRTQLVKRLRIAGNGLGVEIRGIRFDMKHFHRKEETVIAQESAGAGRQRRIENTPGPQELASVTLTEEEFADIQALKTRLTAADGDNPQMHDRIVALYEKGTKGTPLDGSECHHALSDLQPTERHAVRLAGIVLALLFCHSNSPCSKRRSA